MMKAKWNYIYFCTGYANCGKADKNGRFNHAASNLRKCPSCGSKVNKAGRWRGCVSTFEMNVEESNV